MTKLNVGDKVIWNWKNEPEDYHPKYDLTNEVGEVFVVVGEKIAFLRYNSGEYQAHQDNIKLYKEPKANEDSNEVIEVVNNIPEIRQAIQFNLAVWSFDAKPFRDEAENYVAKYKGLDVTEEDVKDINRIIADLNKKIKEFDTVRKEVKGEYNKPFNSFEQEMKSITNVYQEAIDELRNSVDVYEQKYIQQKTEIVNELIQEAISEFKLNPKYAANITLIPKYLNKTETKPKIKKDLAARCQVEFTNQENERLADEARAEKLQRRLDMLNQLNQNYAGRIEKEVLHIDTCNMSDEVLFAWFKDLETQFQAKQAQQAQQPHDYQREIPQSLVRNGPLNIVINEPAKTKVEQFPLGDVPVITEEPPVSQHVKYTYLCTISTTASEDTILPWLKQMKEYGILTYVHKKEIA